jgi:hypothetical protein
MRGLVWLIIGAGTIVGGPPASAESIDTKYPVCMELYTSGGARLECFFWSFDQCWTKTDGMAALCIANRNYVPAEVGVHVNPTKRGF